MKEFFLMYDDVRLELHPERRCWSFCKARTKREPTWRNGIVQSWREPEDLS